MDLGTIDRLLEMLEQHFGRWVKIALLAIVAMGIAAVSLHAFVVYFARPSVHVIADVVAYLSGRGDVFTSKRLLDLLVTVGEAIIASGIFMVIANYLIQPWLVRRLEAKEMRLEEMLDDFYTTAHALATAVQEADAAGIDTSTIIASIRSVPFSNALKRNLLESKRRRDGEKKGSGESPSGQLVRD